jgi:hypothetical protein
VVLTAESFPDRPAFAGDLPGQPKVLDAAPLQKKSSFTIYSILAIGEHTRVLPQALEECLQRLQAHR